MKKFFSLFAAVLFAGSMMAANLLSIDFTEGQGEWTIDNKVMPEEVTYVWQQTAAYGMKASAYVSGKNYETESWLISPAIDLSEVEAAKLFFTHARRYGELDQLSVRAKAGEEEWAVLEVSAWPDGKNWDFIDAEADLAAYAGKADVQIAFVYTSSTSAGATWEIGTVAVTDGADPEPEDEPVVPELPEGVLTVAQAVEAAQALDDPTADNKTVKGDAVVVRGWVIFAYDVSDKGTQSAFISDDRKAKSGDVQGAFLAVEGDGVAKGDYVEISGTLAKFFKAEDNIIVEVIDGTMALVPLEGVENVVLTEKAQKVMVDGVMYIVLDNKMYDVRGTQVR